MSLSLHSVNCNNCAAPLDVAASTNYVTCKHCGSRLAIHRTGSSLFTERIDKLEAKTDAMAETVAELALRDQIEKIDKAWEAERESLLVWAGQGRRRVPTVANAQALGVMATVSGGLAYGIWFESGALCLPVAAGFTALILGVKSWVEWHEAKAYRTAHGLYRIRRMQAKKPDFAPK